MKGGHKGYINCTSFSNCSKANKSITKIAWDLNPMRNKWSEKLKILEFVDWLIFLHEATDLIVELKQHIKNGLYKYYFAEIPCGWELFFFIQNGFNKAFRIFFLQW